MRAWQAGIVDVASSRNTGPDPMSIGALTLAAEVDSPTDQCPARSSLVNGHVPTLRHPLTDTLKRDPLVMNMNRNGTRLWIPLAGSLTVYLVPLVGPHALWLLGEGLLLELMRAGDREPWWLVADLALAFTAQIAVGLLLAWSLCGSRFRLLTWMPAIPTLIAGLNMAYLVAIPPFFHRARHGSGSGELGGALPHPPPVAHAD
jgi:hypothetical protein